MRHIIRKSIAILMFMFLSPGVFASEFDVETIAYVQSFLNQNGYDCGPVDGVAGKRTSEALSRYQKDHGMEVTGQVTEELLGRMDTAEEAEGDGKPQSSGTEERTAASAEDEANEKNYASEYLSILQDLNSVSDSYSFYLIYVDADDTPELVMDTGTRAGGCLVYTYSRGETDCIGMRYPFTYAERQNIILWHDVLNNGEQDFVWILENGSWKQIVNGFHRIDSSHNQYEWDGMVLTEEEYRARLEEAVGKENLEWAVTPEYKMTYEEVCRAFSIAAEHSRNREMSRTETDSLTDQEVSDSSLENFALSQDFLYGRSFHGYYNEKFSNYYDDTEVPSGCLGCVIEDLDGDGEDELLLAIIDEARQLRLEVYEAEGQNLRKAASADSDSLGHVLAVPNGPGILDVFLYQYQGLRIGIDDSSSGLLATGIGHSFYSLVYADEKLQLAGSADLTGSGFIPCTSEPYLSRLYLLGASAIRFEEYWGFDSYLIDYMRGVQEVGRIVTARVSSEEASNWFRTRTPGVVAMDIAVSSKESLWSGDGDHVSKDQYIIPDSNIRLVTAEDLKGLSPEQLRYARNEIFARHGRLFTSPDLQEYFNSRVWYEGFVDPVKFDNEYYNASWGLNETEKKNAEFILNYENGNVR